MRIHQLDVTSGPGGIRLTCSKCRHTVVGAPSLWEATASHAARAQALHGATRVLRWRCGATGTVHGPDGASVAMVCGRKRRHGGEHYDAEWACRW